jgi:HEAT repeat protein
MKIHFCDLCNESVPQADLDEGRAFNRKGRVVCATCDRAMSAGGVAPDSAEMARASDEAAGPEATDAFTPGAEPHEISLETAAPRAAIPASPAASSEPVVAPRSTLSLWVAILAMVFTAGAIYVLSQRLEEAARENRETRDLVARSRNEVIDAQHRMESELKRIVHDQEAVFATRVDSARKETDTKLAGLRDEESKQWSDVQGSVKSLSAWREDVGARGEEDKRRIADLSQRLAKSEDDARQLIERLQSLEQAAKAPPAPAAAPSGKNEPAWKSLLVDLSSPNAGVRWEAVDGLGQAHDPQAVPALLPMLKDPDVFVRMATARVLGDLKATSAVNGLLDALEDNEDAVREAAFVALRGIAGNKDLKFDPLAPEAERAKRLKTLREWWKKEEEAGVGRG